MVSVLGIPFTNLTAMEVFQESKKFLHGQTPRVIITAGPEFVMQTITDPTLAAIVQKADLVTPDGIGIVIASKWYGTPLKERVTGVELAPHLISYAAEAGLRVYILGASEDALRGALGNLRAQHPSLRIDGQNGYFSEEETSTVLQGIRDFAPHLLLVGLGQPRQDRFIDRYRQELGVPLSIGVGGTIDVLAGRVKRAPRIVQKAKMEWFYRLCREPRRFRRQLALPAFAWRAWRDAAAIRAAHQR